MAKKQAAQPSYVGPAWSKAQRAALHGARRQHPLDPPPAPTGSDEGWKLFLRGVGAHPNVAVHGEKAAEVYAPLQRSIESGTMPEQLDVDLEQLRAQLAMAPGRGDPHPPALEGLVAFWLGVGGLGWLVDFARNPRRYSLGHTGGGRFFDGVDHAANGPNHGLGLLSEPQLRDALRRYFFALPEEAFVAQSEAFARALGDTITRISEGYRNPEREASYLAFVLGRDGARAHALLEPDAAGAFLNVPESGLLLASITDLGVATRAVARLKSGMVFDGAAVALDLVETFGRDAAPMLEAILATTVGRKPKTPPTYTRRLEAAIKLAITAP